MPPDGDPPDKVGLVSLTQKLVSGKFRTATGSGKTSMSAVAALVHPLASVKLYVIVCTPSPATEASKLLPVTPTPE